MSAAISETRKRPERLKLSDVGKGIVLEPAVSVIIKKFKDGSRLATLPGSHLSGAGIDTPSAIANLANGVRQTYEDIKDYPDEKLGPLPRRWKREIGRRIKPATS